MGRLVTNLLLILRAATLSAGAEYPQDQQQKSFLDNLFFLSIYPQ